MATRELNFTILMQPGRRGGFIARCPAMPGVVSEGDTLEEARAQAAEAIRGYLEYLRTNGEPIPADVEPVQERIAISWDAA
jgi:predicted RNase H-like HicB family nuclease